MRLLITLIALIIGTASEVYAKTITYGDKDDSPFSFELPVGWTMRKDKDDPKKGYGTMYCEAGDESSFSFSIVHFTALPDPEPAVKAHLQKVVKTMAEGANIIDLKASPVKELTTSKKLTLVEISAAGKVGDESMIIRLTAFAPTDESEFYYIIASVASAEVDRAHQKEMRTILNSITPAEDYYE